MTYRVRPRGPDVWQVSVELGRMPDGRRARKFLTVHGTEAKAHREGRKLLRDVEAGNVVDKDRTTLKEFLELWLEKYAARHCRQKTYENYAYHLTKHVIPNIGALRLTKVTTLHLEDYYADRLERGRLDGKGGLAPRSVHHHHRVLHEAFEHAIKWGYLVKNPAEHATPPRVEAEEPEILTDEETFTAIRAAAGTRWYLPLLLAVFMGLRRGEVLGLRWSAIDWERKSLRVKETYIRLEAGPEFGPTKTHRSKRPVTLPEFLIDALLVEKADQERSKLEFGDHYYGQDLVVCRPDGKPWPPQSFSSGFSTWLQRLPVTQVTFHQLRHSHISQMLEAGENLKAISSRVGHASAAFTLDKYAHVLRGADDGLAQRLNERIQKGLAGANGSNGSSDGGANGKAAAGGEGATLTHSAPQREAEWRQDAKTAPVRGRKVVRIQARSGTK